MRNSTRNANTPFLKQNTHKRVKLPSNFKGKVSHLLMPNTDLKHWQTQTTKTSRNELWFSVLVKNLKTQQEMRQRVCFVSPTGAYIKGKSLLFIAKSITQKKDLILPLPCPSPSSLPRVWGSCTTERGTALGHARCKWKLLLFLEKKKKSSKTIFIFCQLHISSTTSIVTTGGFAFKSFWWLFGSLLHISVFLNSLLKCFIVSWGFSLPKQRKLTPKNLYFSNSELRVNTSIWGYTPSLKDQSHFWAKLTVLKV